MRISKRSLALAALGSIAAGAIAWAAGSFSTLPIVGQPSFCASDVSGVGLPSGQGPFGVVPGSTQGTSSGICGQTVPAGPPFLTGNEAIPADTQLGSVTTTNGAPPATVVIPSGLIAPRINSLIGGDFGQNLWQRGTTPLSAIIDSNAHMAADGFYAYSNGTGYTVSKQTGAGDQPAGSLASMRIQRQVSATTTAPICVGQLVPDDSSGPLIGNAQLSGGRTVVFSLDMLAGANFSPTNNNVTLTIAYHSAADVATASANGQGTNTGTFASSVGTTTQNISGYTEAVNTVVPISTTWTRYSTSAVIPEYIPATTTAVLGVGIKICWTPTGTAGTNDWLEIGKVQLEGRVGQSVGPSPFEYRTLAVDWDLQVSRYWQITDPLTGTPIFANGFGDGTTNQNFQVVFPQRMRIVPTTTPLTAGTSLALDIGGTLTSPINLAVSGSYTTNGQNTNTTAGIKTQNTVTSGQGTQLVGTRLGSGNVTAATIGFSAEP